MFTTTLTRTITTLAGVIALGVMCGVASAAPAPGRVADGVSIGGLDVSGMTERQARAAVLSELVAPKRRPLDVAFRGRFIELEPVYAGYVADVDYAIKGAMNFGRSQPERVVDVPLRERVKESRIRRILEWYNARFARSARDAELTFTGAGTPKVTPPRLGLEIDVEQGIERVRRGILERSQERFRLPTRRYRPERTGVGFSVVVDRRDFDLRLYKGEQLMRTMTVAVGTSQHPTPAGRFVMTRLDKNPVWYPPDSRWAEGLGPVQPGRGNPLGTRWMGISAYAIGIHGTPQPETLGSRASHGCIRLSIVNAEWLFNLVERGTAVKII